MRQFAWLLSYDMGESYPLRMKTLGVSHLLALGGTVHLSSGESCTSVLHPTCPPCILCEVSEKLSNMYSSMLGLESSRPTHCFKSCTSYLHRGTVCALALIITVSNKGSPQVGLAPTRWCVQCVRMETTSCTSSVMLPSAFSMAS